MTVQDWWLWWDHLRSAPENMAADDALLQTAAEFDRPLLRLYRWPRPALSIGYFQAYAAVAAGGRDVVRRPTGGGIVAHGADLTFTILFPPGHELLAVDREVSYARINRAVIAGATSLGLEPVLTEQVIPKSVDRRTMACFATPTRYDVMLDGCKLAGGAQRRSRQAMLHQGSLDLSVLGCSWTAAATALQQGIQSGFGAAYADFSPTAALEALIAELTTEKHAAASWLARY